MNVPFAPRVKDTPETYKSRLVWVVDCRQWGPQLKRMGHPLRRRFAKKVDAEESARTWTAPLRGEKRGRPDYTPAF